MSLRVWLTLLLLGGVFASVDAQTKDQLILKVEQISPDKAAQIQKRLDEIIRVSTTQRMVTVRDLDGTSVMERQQLSANPTFAKAYDQSPASTLLLLRTVDAILGKTKPVSRP